MRIHLPAYFFLVLRVPPPPAPSVSANASESSNVPEISGVPRSASISVPEDHNISESASTPVSPRLRNILLLLLGQISVRVLHQFISCRRWLTPGRPVQPP